MSFSLKFKFTCALFNYSSGCKCKNVALYVHKEEETSTYHKENVAKSVTGISQIKNTNQIKNVDSHSLQPHVSLTHRAKAMDINALLAITTFTLLGRLRSLTAGIFDPIQPKDHQCGRLPMLGNNNRNAVSVLDWIEVRALCGPGNLFHPNVEKPRAFPRLLPLGFLNYHCML